jgi:diadenosine tetraphosphate (Ap4A) HIT family hydrolase
MKKKNSFINLNNARLEEQTKVMEDIAKAEHCPFCIENLKKYHKKPILKEGKYWLLTENQWPYENTKKHFLIIYKEHANKLSEIENEAFAELIEIAKEVEEKEQIKGGGLSMRFGDTDYSAGTVDHIHVQLIEPDIHKKDFEEVNIVLGRKI